MQILVGDTFDEFRVIEKIGTGSFSEVFLAHDTILDRVVVLKQLSPKLSRNKKEWDAFINEAQVTATFFHPGIINIHALRIDKQRPSLVLVLEYMDGGTLRDMLLRQQALPLAQVWNLAFQVGNALRYLHERGIIHRDIKPENILYSEETRWFKLTDFGLAYDPRRPEFEALNNGQPGTLRYMSPEQAQNKTVIDGRSDQYTLAAVLYEALSGEHYLPLNEKTMTDDEIVEQITDGYPLRLPMVHHTPLLVEKLENVMLRALAKRPERRYKNVSRFIHDFTRVLEYMESTPKDDPDTEMN